MAVKVGYCLHEALQLDHIGIFARVGLLAETLEKFQRFATFIISFEGWDIFKKLRNWFVNDEKKEGSPASQIPHDVLIGSRVQLSIGCLRYGANYCLQKEAESFGFAVISKTDLLFLRQGSYNSKGLFF